MLVLRAWIQPPLAATGQITTPSGHAVNFVQFSEERDEKRARYTVASLPWTGNDPEVPLMPAWDILSECVSLVCFAEMSHSTVVAARVEEDVPAGTECMFVGYPTIPSSNSLCMPFGFPQTKRRLSETPALKRPEIRAALSWLLRAQRSFDAFDRTMYIWICLEALTPPMKAPPTCDKCRNDLTCPTCSEPPHVYRVVAAIEKYLTNHLDRKAFRRLYELRSKMVHGQLMAGGKDSEKLSQQSMTLTRLAIEVMKAELGWDARSEPHFDLQGGTTNHLSIKSVQVCSSEESKLSPHLLDLELVMTDLPIKAASVQVPRRRRH
jgi:hypothetical protein